MRYVTQCQMVMASMRAVSPRTPMLACSANQKAAFRIVCVRARRHLHRSHMDTARTRPQRAKHRADKSEEDSDDGYPEPVDILPLVIASPSASLPTEPAAPAHVRTLDASAMDESTVIPTLADAPAEPVLVDEEPAPVNEKSETVQQPRILLGHNKVAPADILIIERDEQTLIVSDEVSDGAQYPRSGMYSTCPLC
jgi:hypothetical protein